jgi:hypothetical protein
VGVGAVGKNAARKAAEKFQATLALGDLSILKPMPVAKPNSKFRDVAAD